VGLRYNPPPGWPPAPPGFTPQPGWQPDPSWPTPPPGWQLWVNDDQLPPGSLAPQTLQAPESGSMPVPPLPGYGAGTAMGSAAYGGGGYGNPGSPYGTGAPGAAFTGTGTQYPGGPGPYGTAPGPYGIGGPYAPGMPAPGSKAGKMSGWAIAAFIFGLIGGIVISPILAAIALSRIKRHGQRGRGLAITSFVLSALWLVGIIAVAVVGNSGQASRSASNGSITHAGKLNVFSLAVGDCFDNPAGASTVGTVTAVPCNQAHNAQVFAKFKLSGSDSNYPGNAAVTRLATDGCNSRTGDVDRSMTTNSMTIRLIFPEATAWLAGQRTVDCMIVNPAPTLTSSLLNS
jgi:Septum formation